MKTESNSRDDRILAWRVVGAALTLVIVIVCSGKFEDIKEHFPDITTLQLQSYDWLSHITARKPRPQWVMGVEIDDTTFFRCLGEASENDVTDRAFLAGLIDRAVDAGAAVVALDIDLREDNNDRDTSNQARRGQNQAFFDAIRRAQKRNVPVVLTRSFDYDSRRPMEDIREGSDSAEPATAAKWNCPAADEKQSKAAQKPQKNAPSKSQQNAPSNPQQSTPSKAQQSTQPAPQLTILPTRLTGSDPTQVRSGFDFAPMDKRRVPLVLNGDAPQASPSASYPSFALQVVDAYEHTASISPKTIDRLRHEIDKGYYVYTSFLREYSHAGTSSDSSGREAWLDVFDKPSANPPHDPCGVDIHTLPVDYYEFPHVSAADVFDGDDCSLRKLRHRIVLVGGHRHAQNPDQGSSAWLDYHRGPEGPMLGMYLHANYIEGMLDNRIKRRISTYAGIALDFVLALAIIAVGWNMHELWKRVVLILIAILVVMLLYGFFVAGGFCLDVLAVLLIMFLHSGWEHYWHLQMRVHTAERKVHGTHHR